jgi:hypothetical protein
MALSDLLEAEGRLVAHLEPLPFQEGRPLATAAEGSTVLVDASSHELTSRQVLVAEEGEDDGGFPVVDFEAVSEDEATANAGEENDADREARRARNRARAIQRRRATNRARPTTTTTTLAGAKPLAGGNSHLQEVTRDRPIIGLLRKTCASTLMKAAMREL